MKKKVLLFSDCYLFGGSEHVIYNIIRNPFLKENYEFSFLYRHSKLYEENVKKLQYEKYCKAVYNLYLLNNYTLYNLIRNAISSRFLRRFVYAPFYLLEKSGLYDFYNRLVIARFLKDHHDFDIVHINNGGYPGAFSCLQMALEIKKYSRIKVLMQINNLAQEGRESVDSSINSSVDYFITASKHARNAFLHKRRMDEEKVGSLPNYVEDASLSGGSKANKLSDKKQCINVVQVALIQERKGQRYLIDAISYLNANSSDEYHLYLIGNGEQYDLISQYVDSQKLGKYVHLLGYRNDYIDYLRNADIVALPSIKDEDMPLIILTAMSMSKAIVTTDIGGISEEIEDGISGILLDPKSDSFSRQLADAIVQAYKDKDYLGKNAYERYQKCFSAKSYAEKLTSIYSKLC